MFLGTKTWAIFRQFIFAAKARLPMEGTAVLLERSHQILSRHAGKNCIGEDRSIRRQCFGGKMLSCRSTLIP